MFSHVREPRWKLQFKEPGAVHRKAGPQREMLISEEDLYDSSFLILSWNGVRMVRLFPSSIKPRIDQRKPPLLKLPLKQVRIVGLLHQ
jgi:hypothetical protein